MHRVFACLAITVLVVSRDVCAQNSEAIGIRAQGMGGAFTAVADDASATWWNPAGLANGAFFNLILEVGSLREPDDEKAVPGWRTASRGFAVAYPALGLSYYRLRVSEIQPNDSTASGAADRQDPGAAKVRLRSLILNQFGMTVGQSLGTHVVVASTLKVIRGGAAVDVRDRVTTSIEAADDLRAPAETHAGLDVGAMAKFGGITLGVTVRNATQPTYGDGAATFNLTRQARAGIAVRSDGGHGFGQVTVDGDIDITETEGVFGRERHLGAGAEVWTPARRFGIRGGVNGTLPTPLRPAPSGGISMAVRTGTYVDAYVTWGTDEARRGWGSALRVTF